jgi:hypothetical protein
MRAKELCWKTKSLAVNIVIISSRGQIINKIKRLSMTQAKPIKVPQIFCCPS